MDDSEIDLEMRHDLNEWRQDRLPARADQRYLVAQFVLPFYDRSHEGGMLRIAFNNDWI